MTMNPLWYVRKQQRFEKKGRAFAMRKSKQLASRSRGMNLEENEVFAIVNELGYTCKQQQSFYFTSKPHFRIVDIWLPDHYIAIEVDGSNHFTDIGKLSDEIRTKQFADEYPHVKFIRVSHRDIKKEGFKKELHKTIFNMNTNEASNL